MKHIKPAVVPNQHQSWHGRPLSELSRAELIEATQEALEMINFLIDERARADKQYANLLFRV